MIEDSTIVIIPARYGSTRFPGKPLATLGGKAIILHVCQRVTDAGFNAIVATDDERIKLAVENAGFKAIMTSSNHKSGTDRIREALDKYESMTGTHFEVVINVQGDEPFIDGKQLKLLMNCFDDPEVDIATLCRHFPESGDYSELSDPNLVKIVRNNNEEAIYFSRSVIPYLRGIAEKDYVGSFDFLTHIGLYGYRAEVLRRVTELPTSSLEKAESLEQLRWLQAGYKIKAPLSESRNIGIDTPADLKAAEKELLKYC